MRPVDASRPPPFFRSILSFKSSSLLSTALRAALALAIAGAAVAASSRPMSLHFQFENSSAEPAWVAVNDGVMGGRSSGGPALRDGILRFEGTLSLENNGGFSSIRTTGRGFDLSAAEGIVLRVRGDGRTYQLRLATEARFRGARIAYRADFATAADEWIEVEVPFNEMVPGWRGRRLSGPPLDLTAVSEVGLLLGDGRPGPFQLEVDWIKTFDHR